MYTKVYQDLIVSLILCAEKFGKLLEVFYAPFWILAPGSHGAP